MAEFAGYGFNKSHSCAYALLAYQTAYLKTHYPVEFMAALLTSETGNTEKVVKYINEARGMGITVLPPDVNSQRPGFHAGRRSRFASACAPSRTSAKTRSREFWKRARSWAASTRSFNSATHVDTRLLNRRVLESLIKAGAMDSLGARRAQIYAVIDRAMERGQQLAARTHQRPARPFRRRVGGRRARRAEPCPTLEEWPEHELLAAEFATLGFYISGHPLAKYAARLKELGASIWPPSKAAATAKRSPSPASWSPCAPCARAKAIAGESSLCRT